MRPREGKPRPSAPPAHAAGASVAEDGRVVQLRPRGCAGGSKGDEGVMFRPRWLKSRGIAACSKQKCSAGTPPSSPPGKRPVLRSDGAERDHASDRACCLLVAGRPKCSKETELEGPEPALRLALRSLNRQALNRWSLTQYLNLGSRGLRRAGRRGADRRRRRGRRDGQLGAPAADGARGAASRPLGRLERARRLLR